MGKTVVSPAAVLHAAAVQVLAERGPLDLDDLAGVLTAQGIRLGPDPDERLLDVVLDYERVQDLDDGRLVDVLTLSEGLVLSHELSAAEVASGRVALNPDFTVLDDLVEAGVTMSTATGSLDHDHDDDIEGHCVLVGPDGWLGRSPVAGDTLTIGIQGGRSAVVVGRGSVPVTSEEAVSALGTAFDLFVDDRDEAAPVQIFDVWLEAMVAEPDAFRRPHAPLGRLLLDADLEARGELVAPADFDWEEWEEIATLDQVARRWGLDDAGGLAWKIMTTAYERFADGHLDLTAEVDDDELDDGDVDDGELDDGDLDDDSADEVWAGVAAMASYGMVARAFVGEELGGERDLDGSVAAFARHLADSASGKAKAAPLWIQSICAERDGRTLDAETFILDAVLANGSFELALEDAAWYAADRGDARRAASLLRQAGVDADDETLALYDRYARVPPAQVGRNEKCPCGSGRKYKHCHLAKAALPLTERCRFLYDKAVAYLVRGRDSQQFFQIADAFSGQDATMMAIRDNLQEPVVADLALFEGGVWDHFLRDRGVLLPSDEMLLAQQWLLIERSVYEIQAVRPGQGFTTRDIRTGDVVDVVERSGSRQLKSGELICARIVPDGEGYQIFGGIERVGLHQRDYLIAVLDAQPSGTELAAWFAAAHAPPRMVNYEREPMVLCTLTYATDDPDGAAAVLDDLLQPTNPGEWIESIDTEQMEKTIRGFVRIEGDTITVEANSEIRADRLRTLVTTKLPGLRALGDIRIPAADAIADRAAFGASSAPPELPEGAEEFMEQFARDYERRWVDMSIPALGGLTPRQAADDPTRREDLMALLTSFDIADTEHGASGAGMNVDRIRAMLGLTT